MSGLAARLRPLLENVAGRRETLTYAALARLAQIEPPHSIHKLVEALEALMTRDAAAGRPLLAAIVVSRARAQDNLSLPAPGFFQHAAGLGRYFGPDRGPQAATFHALELEKVWMAHGAGRGGSVSDGFADGAPSDRRIATGRKRDGG